MFTHHNLIVYNDCIGLRPKDRKYYATPPPYSPNTVDQTVDFGGATWKGQPGGGWNLQRENPEATNYSATPQKTDINPQTGKMYAVNPDTGNFDDNYWSSVVEPSLGGGMSGANAGLDFAQPSLNLPQLYESLYKSSGISDAEKGLFDKTNQYNSAVSGIKDNPYLSEGTMTGRIKKLDDRFRADETNIKNDIAMKKADIETKLNLQTKQFDINSQIARDALDKFNSLLSAGALSGASGSDIANLTRSTGLSSSMIQSAIKASQAKNVQTSTIQFDDGKNQGFLIVNDQTGEIINRQIIGASKPTGGSGAKATTSDYSDLLKQDARSGLTLSQIFNIYSGYLTPDQIYQLYNSSSKYGPDKGSVTTLAKYGVTQPKTTSTRST